MLKKLKRLIVSVKCLCCEEEKRLLGDVNDRHIFLSKFFLTLYFCVNE